MIGLQKQMPLKYIKFESFIGHVCRTVCWLLVSIRV